MYVSPNFTTKKALREAVKNGEDVRVISAGPYPAPTSGRVDVEGPHAPKPHTWYGSVTVKDGRVVSVA